MMDSTKLKVIRYHYLEGGCWREYSTLEIRKRFK